MDLYKYIRNIEHFPKAGVHFKDITPLLADSAAMESCVEQLLAMIENQKIDKVAAIESRGFFFGTLLAQKLNAGFVPVRKPGKLPYKTLKEPYQLEYGMDALEIHEDAILKGERVLLHDDVLATGGTAKAACNLIEGLGGVVVQCNFLLEIEFLNGIKKLQNKPVKSLLKF
ncbi:adenine phosphoribosyltransferase [Aequorivita sp. F47161]|uniref:Adenine phosphoribosyltransferase n=1 Tax=Aequorivita vitellina TaxID=2874475 RepID=A0A9X1QUY5_9FLAO|nr:adenine phosphoribosyltransferase [Aequorivita vitellina]MCG2419996.1 adenine phosphoribosyltransferase [Aequorivita vitellina]